jgi:hypothetical protein
MTYAEQLVKLGHAVPADPDGYTKEELVDLYKSAKSIMLFAACALAEWEDK